MPVEWKGTKFSGVRFYENATRKHGVKRDRYFAIRYQAGGKRIEEGLGWASEGWTEQKAALKLAELKTAAKTGNGPTRLKETREIEKKRKEEEQAEKERQEREAVTFGKYFLETYLPQARIDRPKSVRADEGLCETWVMPVIGKLSFGEIESFHIEKIKKNILDSGRTPRTLEYIFGLIRQTFNSAKRNGLFAGDCPTANVKRPRVDNARLRYLSPEEAERLLNKLAERSIDVHDQALLSLHCGLRFGEIVSLTWADVSLEKGTLTIRDAKTGSRTVFLTARAVEALGKRKKGLPSDYVFPARAGGKIPILSQTFFRVVKELKFNEGIIDPRLKVCFHTLRHSHATLLYGAMGDLYLVQKSLGHRTPTMAMRYAKMTEGKLKEAAQILGRALDTKKAEGNDGEVVNLTK